MKNTIAFLALIMSLTSFANEVTVDLRAGSAETEVVVTELKEPPASLPRRPNERPPRWWKLTLFGLGLAPIEFLISTAIHEGSHALIGATQGVEITDFHPYPHQHDGYPFRFGDVHWRGRFNSPAGEAVTLAAPMFLDTAILGTYGGLVLSNALPENRFAKMSIFVFAAGHWVDMANHIIARNEQTDTRRIEYYLQDYHNLTDLQSKLVVRGSQALVLAVGGYFLYRGFRQIFKDTVGSDTAERSVEQDSPDRRRAERERRRNQRSRSGSNLFLSPSVSSDMGGVVFGGSF